MFPYHTHTPKCKLNLCFYVLDHNIDIAFNNQCLHNINKILRLHSIKTECRSQSLKENIRYECMCMQVLQAMNGSGIESQLRINNKRLL